MARSRDPALLEFAGHALVRSSAFRVEPKGGQRPQVTYEPVLEQDVRRVDYVLPRSASNDYEVPWSAVVDIRSRRGISTVYSPSQELNVRRLGSHRAAARLRSDAGREPGPFRLSCLFDAGGSGASVFAYPDPAAGGGFFLLLMALPGDARSQTRLERELTPVLDRSGSMNRESTIRSVVRPSRPWRVWRRGRSMPVGVAET